MPAREDSFGIYEFRFVWKVDESTVFVLEWKQTFSPLEPQIEVNASCTTPATCVPAKQYNIEVFNQITCNVQDTRLRVFKLENHTGFEIIGLHCSNEPIRTPEFEI